MASIREIIGIFLYLLLKIQHVIYWVLGKEIIKFTLVMLMVKSFIFNLQKNDILDFRVVVCKL